VLAVLIVLVGILRGKPPYLSFKQGPLKKEVITPGNV
jgi:hypothetical protein